LTISLKKHRLLINVFVFSLFFSTILNPVQAETGKLLPGLYAGTYYIGGLSRSEFSELLAPECESVRKRKITLLTGDGAHSALEFAYEQLGIEFDTERIWQEACQIGQSGPFWQRWQVRWQIKKRGKVIPLYLKLNKDKAFQFLQEQTKNLTIPARDARITVTAADKIRIIPALPGRAPDLTQLIATMESVINKGHSLAKTELPLAYTILEPQVTTRDVQGYQITGLLSSFSTSYSVQKKERAKNISLATAAIGEYILAPGQVFSFNEVVGPRTRQRGYEEAPVILNNEMVLDLGGGVCQVSTTLYNAVLRAQLEAVKRYPHSMPIGYVEPGLDATVAYDYLDFAFRNNTSGYLLIKGAAQNGTVNFKIYGFADNRRKVVLKSIKEKEVPPEVVFINDPAVPQGKYIVDKEGSAGLYVRVERYVYDDSGKLLDKEIISRDYYPPVSRIIRTSTDISLLTLDPDLSFADG